MNFKRKLISSIVCLFMLINVTACGKCEHQWGKLKLVSESTCTEEGVKERACKLCGETTTVTIPMTSHKWKYATCTAPKTCKVCAITEGSPLNHVYKENKKTTALKTQATPENPIEVYYKSCSCGKISETETFEVKTMTGKNILIFGDSYSSYKGTIPNGYRVYYEGVNILNSPDQMWWSLLTQERGGTVIRNDSSSGSTIGYTGYVDNNGVHTDTSNGVGSFIYRLEKLIASGYFTENQVDYVFVLGGTNDSWCGAPLGEEMYEGWTKSDLYNVLPAICYFYSKIREVLPNAEIYGIANHVNMKQEVIDVIKHATEHVGGKAVILKNIETASSHPSEYGMKQIKDQILKEFDK